MIRRFFLLALLLQPLYIAAVVETFQFEDEVTRQRYQQFIQDLRCPKCQNQNLDGSNAPIAHDLRRELYRLLQEGKSDTEITQFMVARYGEFVLYRPPLNRDTAWLWFAPPLMLAVGFAVVWLVLRRRRRTVDSPPLTVEQRERLNRILAQERDE